MKRRTKHILGVCAILLGSGIAYGGYFYLEVWRPHQLMRDSEWYHHASEDEARTVCHKVISHRFGDPHDAFLFLEEKGNATSVPLIIGCLKWQTAPSNPHRNCCTTGHGFAALHTLTGESFGSYEEWTRWWKETGSKLPSTNFYVRAANKASESSVAPAPQIQR